MIGWFVPHSIYPAGYHCDPKQGVPFAGLASQKNHIGLYLMCVYGDEEHAKKFREDWAKSGKRLDMGKSCVRFKSADDVPLDVVTKTVKRVPVKKFLAQYEAEIPKSARKKTKKKTAKKAPAKKKTVRKKR